MLSSSYHFYFRPYIKWPGLRTRYSDLLQPGRSGVRIPMWTRDFLYSTPGQTAPWAHPAFCRVGTGALSQR